MKRTVCLILTIFVLISRVFSVPLESILPSQALYPTGDLITETQSKNPSPKLMPADSELRQFFAKGIETLNPNIMVESLYLYKKPQNSGDWDTAQKTGLYNQLLAISTLAGIQYYSASRGAMRTLFEYSRVIDGPDTRNVLPDPVYSVPPAQVALFSRQKDLTFGDNIYRYNYATTGDGIFFIQENVTALNYSLVPAIGKGNLRSIMAVFDCGDILLIYIASMAKAASVPGMGERIGTSFTNRAEAIIKWFINRTELVYQ
jgi:uncharacterized membrane protein